MSYAVNDIASACSNVRSWGYLASKQIQFEYRRSLLGSLWIVVAFVLPATGIGALMAQLQGRPIDEHVPYVLFGFAAWNFIIGMVTGGSNVLINAKPYLLQMPLARSVFVLSLTLRNFYLLAIHLAAAVVVAWMFGWRPSPMALWVLPATFVYVVAGFGTALLLGHLCVRVPDLSPLIASIMRLSFFFTPIIWVPGTSARGEADGLLGILMQWNPFSHLLLMFRDGLLGLPAGSTHWVVAIVLTCTLAVLGFVALQLLGRRITYWL